MTTLAGSGTSGYQVPATWGYRVFMRCDTADICRMARRLPQNSTCPPALRSTRTVPGSRSQVVANTCVCAHAARTCTLRALPDSACSVLDNTDGANQNQTSPTTRSGAFTLLQASSLSVPSLSLPVTLCHSLTHSLTRARAYTSLSANLQARRTVWKKEMLTHSRSHGAKSVGDGRDGGDARWQLLKQGALYLSFTLTPLVYSSKGQSVIKS